MADGSSISRYDEAIMAFRNAKSIVKSIFFPRSAKPPFNHICQVGDPVLRMVAEKVHLEDISHPAIQIVIKQMTKAHKHYECLGLAAPQIGIPLRIFLMKVPKNIKKVVKSELNAAPEVSELPLTIFINPEMKISDYDKVILTEGCESVRGYSADVSRYKSVEISGWNEEGKEFSKSFSGLLARIAQHEMDHLDGKLYIDRMEKQTFENTAWQKINVHEGRVKIQFY